MEIIYTTIPNMELKASPPSGGDLLIMHDGSSAKRITYQNLTSDIPANLGISRTTAIDPTLANSIVSKTIVYTGAAASNITLPSATLIKDGSILCFVNRTNFPVTITPNSAALINGNNNYQLNFFGDVVTLVSDKVDNGWFVMSQRKSLSRPTYSGNTAAITTREGILTTASLTTAAATDVLITLTSSSILASNILEVRTIVGGSIAETSIVHVARTECINGSGFITLRNIGSAAFDGTVRLFYRFA